VNNPVIPVSETQVQISIIEFLRAVLPAVEVVHVPNQGQRSLWFAQLLKRLGMRTGAADLIVFVPQRVICIEVKRPASPGKRKGVESDAQIDFGLSLNALGHTYIVAYSVDDVRKALVTLGIPTREVREA